MAAPAPAAPAIRQPQSHQLVIRPNALVRHGPLTAFYHTLPLPLSQMAVVWLRRADRVLVPSAHLLAPWLFALIAYRVPARIGASVPTRFVSASLVWSLCMLHYAPSAANSIRVATMYTIDWFRQCLGYQSRLLSEDRARLLTQLVQGRDDFRDPDLVHDPVAPPPPFRSLMPEELARLAGPFAVSVSLELKAQGHGSAGEDRPDTRRVAYQLACDIMRRHGMRPAHIANSAPIAVALAFIPLPGEVAAAQIAAVELSAMRREQVSAEWRDPMYVRGRSSGAHGVIDQ